MARTGITYDEVAQAADAISAGGDQPTIRAVREVLGTGSPNTVHKHLMLWREARPQAAATAPALPDSLTAAISKEIEKAASAARAEIESRLVQIQAEADDLATAGEALEAERNALADQVAVLTTDRDQAQATAAERAAEITRQAEIITREQAAAEAARIDLATARVKVEALSHALDEARAEIQTLRAALDEHRAARQSAEQSAAVLAARMEASASEIRKIEGRADLEAKRAAKEAEAAAAVVKASRAELDAAKAEAAKAREVAAKAEGQAEAMRARIEALDRALAVASAAHADDYTPAKRGK